MKRRFLALLLLPLMLTGCGSSAGSYKSVSVDKHNLSGEIGSFSLISPIQGYSSSVINKFEWEAANNASFYTLEIASTEQFVTDDSDEVYVSKSNISTNTYEFNASLPIKDITYYWRVTAKNSNSTKLCNSTGVFFFESVKQSEIKFLIEDPDDYQLHEQGSYADISIDNSDFFGNGEPSLAITFEEENTKQGIDSSDGWMVITKTEDKELYGTDALYFNFYYSGNDANVFVRFVDFDGEYWHKQIQIANNAKQTVLLKFEDFELRTRDTTVNNRVFNYEHIRYFEIVFEKSFGDGVCLFSNIKAVNFSDYKYMFMDKMNFKESDQNTWYGDPYNTRNVISEDGYELTMNYSTSPDENNEFGINKNGYTFEHITLNKYFTEGDAIKMQVKVTGYFNANMNFLFRLLEEDNDRWQYKQTFTQLVKDEYVTLVIPFKAMLKTDYLNGDGARQFYFIQKFQFGVNNAYGSGAISVKDIEIVYIKNEVTDTKRYVLNDGIIDNFSTYKNYAEMYYYWLPSSTNKDEAILLDTAHKTGGNKNTACAEIQYKSDMGLAYYELYLDTAQSNKSHNALSLWLQDASSKSDAANLGYLSSVSAECVIQLVLDSGEWYRYQIKALEKEWKKYTISFNDFVLFNEGELLDAPNPISVEHIVHFAIGLQYFYYDQAGKPAPAYTSSNSVYMDEIMFVTASNSSIETVGNTLHPDAADSNLCTIETAEYYEADADVFDMWSYGSQKDYNSITVSNYVSKYGGSKSLKMGYKGSDSVSYVCSTLFGKDVKAKGLSFDLKGDGKATVYMNINVRNGANTYKLRYSLNSLAAVWSRYTIGFSNFKDVNGSAYSLSQNEMIYVESISIGIVNGDNSNSSIYLDNLVTTASVTYSQVTSYELTK